MTATSITTPAIPADVRTELLDAEVTYQAARAELAAAEDARYLTIYRAYVAARNDTRTLAAETPATITRATIAGAVRRHGEPADWAQLALDLEES